MYDFKITKTDFMINGKKELLLCGELHYFRMEKQYWEKALDALVDCGCNAVAYYVPWFVHEYEEGKFDFTGELCPENDLHTWIQLTQKKGLLGFFRPGPYVYAETTDLGLPKWFSQKYRNAHVKGYQDGKYVDVGMKNNVAHNHPDFIRAAERWYKAVCGEIQDYLAPKGNIVMFQLCNEIPTEDLDDRNPENLGIGREDGLYPRYLTEKYGQASRLNQYYESDFSDLLTIEPHMLEAANPSLAQRDHLEFVYDFYFPAYFQTLRKIARNNGVQVEMIHNAYNPRAISLHYGNNRKNPWLNIGIDCYYSLTGQLGIREGTYFCDYGAEYASNFLAKAPWVIEQESGYWKDYPQVYGPELYLWNLWTIAAGYRGFNMFLFAGCENRPGMGWYGTDHNWQTPVSRTGERLENYPYLARSLSEIKKNQEDLTAPVRHDLLFGVKNDPGLIWKRAARASNDFYFVLKSAGFTPRVCDFAEEPMERLKEAQALCVLSDEAMDETVQEKLCEFVKEGGRLILCGRVPTRDSWSQSCTLLADMFGICAEEMEDKGDDQQKLKLDGKEYYIGRTVQPIMAAAKNILAAEDAGNPAVFYFTLGQGELLLLPFSLEPTFYSQAEAVKLLLGKIGVKPYIFGAKRLRIIPKQNGKAVALNPNPVAAAEEVCLGERRVAVSLEPYEYAIL